MNRLSSINVQNMLLVNLNDLDKIQNGRIIHSNKNNNQEKVYVVGGKENNYIVVLKNKNNGKYSYDSNKVRSFIHYNFNKSEDSNYILEIMHISSFLKLMEMDKSLREMNKTFEKFKLKNASLNRNFLELVSKECLNDILNNKSYEKINDVNYENAIYIINRKYIDSEMNFKTYDSKEFMGVVILRNRKTNKISETPSKIDSLLEYEEYDFIDPKYDIEIIPIDVYLNKIVNNSKQKTKGKKLYLKPNKKVSLTNEIVGKKVKLLNNRYLVSKDDLFDILKNGEITNIKNDFSNLYEKIFIERSLCFKDGSMNYNYKVLLLKNKNTNKITDKPEKLLAFFKYEEYGLEDPLYNLEKRELSKYLHKKKIKPFGKKLDNNINNQINLLYFNSINNTHYNIESDEASKVCEEIEIFKENKQEDISEKETLLKIEKILSGNDSNDILYIDEYNKLVYYPYNIEKVKKLIDGEKYKTASEVIEDVYVKDFSKYSKNSFKNRYKECYKIIKTNEKYSELKTIIRARKYAKNKYMLPVYISACNSEEEIQGLNNAIHKGDIKKFYKFNVEYILEGEKMARKSKEKMITDAIEAESENNALIICEDVVYFPYTINELEDYLKLYPVKYLSRKDVVKDCFIRDYAYYKKNNILKRFVVAYDLFRDEEFDSPVVAFIKATLIAVRTKIEPVVIAACKSEDELLDYVDASKNKNLKAFKDFKIIY